MGRIGNALLFSVLGVLARRHRKLYLNLHGLYVATRSVRCKLIPGVATIFPSHILHSVVSTPSEHHRFAGRPILAYKGTKYPVLTSHLANAGVANGRRNAL